MTVNLDALTQIHNLLFGLLQANTNFAALGVKPANWIPWTGQARDPIKDEVQGADLPEIRLTPANQDLWQIIIDSSGSSWEPCWNIEVPTGDKRVNAALFPIAMEVFRALSNWPSLMAGNPFTDSAGCPFQLTHVITKSADFGMVPHKELNRDVRGWAAIFTIKARLDWITTQLIASIPTGS